MALGKVSERANAVEINPDWDIYHGSTKLNGTVPISRGGTGATTAAAARSQLGVVSKSGDTMTGNLTIQGSLSSITDLKKAKKVVVSFDGDGVSKILSARVLTSKDVHDYNDFGKPDVVKPVAFKDYKITKAGIELTLPPCSVVVLAAK